MTLRPLFAFLLLITAAGRAQEVVLADKGKTSFQIVLPASPDSNETKAAKALQQYIKAISGVTLNIGPARAAGNVFIGKASALTGSGYAWKLQGKNLHIAGSSPNQTLETVYFLLEDQLGCRFLSPSGEYIPRSGRVVLKNSNYSYTPRIRTRTVHARLFYDNPEFAAKRRVTTEGFPDFVPVARVHTFNRFIPEKQYYHDHPEYYALVKGKRLPTQLCLSNDTVYNLVRDSVRVFFGRYPNSGVISVSQDDNTQYCTCERCKVVDDREGTPAASMMLFVNRIAREFPNKTISTLAYQYTRRAPRTIKPEKNVLVTLCSIECDRSGAIADKCKDFERDLKEWGALGSTIQIWDYTTQFTNFLAPFPNMQTLRPNINLFVDNGANWIFEQHSHQWSDLYEMRCWIMSQLLWNPAASYDSLLNVFCSAYYGAAGPDVERYVKELEASIREYPKFYLFLYGDPAQGFDTWLSGAKLQAWNRLFDDAEKKLAGDRELTRRLHAAIAGLDFATLEYYRLNKSPYLLSDKQAIGAQLARFEQTCNTNGIRMMNEMGLPRTDYVNAYRKLVEGSGAVNLAKGANVVLQKKPTKYAKEDPQALTDGAFGGWSFYANWLGFLDTMHATIDLGSVKDFSSISTSFLQVTNHVVFFPTRVDFEISEDGQRFTRVASVDCIAPLTKQSKVNDIWQVGTGTRPMRARYVRVIGNNMNTPPYWHHAAGTGAWIFADEVLVQ